MGKAKYGLRAAALASVVAMSLAACGGGSSNGGSTGSSGSGDKPVKGGTLTFLTTQDQLDHMDPARVYTGEDLAFFGGTVQRSLTAYKFSADAKEGTSVQADLATDTGTTMTTPPSGASRSAMA